MAQGVRERKGQLGGYDIYLARWTERPYAHLYREIQPDRVDIPGTPGKIEGDPSIRSWIIDDWRGGRGEHWWKEGLDAFDEANGLRPAFDGGLILPPTRSAPQTDAPATMAASGVFGYNNTGKLYTARDTTRDGYEWDPTNEQWDVKTGLSTVSTGYYESMTDYVSGHGFFLLNSNGHLVKWNPGVTATVHYSSFGAGALQVFAGALYGATGRYLYLVDKTTATTRTEVVDMGAAVGVSPQGDRHITATDRGVMWLRGGFEGKLEVHEYNHFLDEHSIFGVVPIQHASQNSAVFYGKGFAWVLTGRQDATTKGGWLWFKSGGQEGLVTVPASAAMTGSYMSIAGFLNDELIFNFRGAVWAYNVTTGGLYRVAFDFESDPWSSALYDDDLFVGGGTTDSGRSTRYQLAEPDASGAEDETLDTGEFDFDYPGFQKIFREVVIYTNDYDGADGVVNLAYSVDGGSFTSIATGCVVSSTNRRHVFRLSDSSTSVTGTTLNLRLRLKGDGTDAPMIERVVARAVPSESVEEFILELDVSSAIGSRDGTSYRSSQLLTWLRTVVEAGGVHKFTNPWENEDHEAATDYDVEIIEVILPEAGNETLEQGVANVRLRLADPEVTCEEEIIG